MKLKFTSVPQSEIDRRIENLRSYTAKAADAVIADMVDAHNPITDAMGTDAEVTARAVVDMVSAAMKAEKIVASKVAADAVADLYSAATDKPLPLARIIAHRIPRPTHNDRPGRVGSFCKWRCETEEGVVLVASTDYPLADSAAVLLILHGLPDNTPVTLRHSDKGHDHYRPMKLGTAAAHGIKRLEDRTMLRLSRVAA
ncbi:hypothetical protein EEB11_00235 [Pseudotabrizicola sediminis]|uniref:Uncharacterized protein n=1 Tax=Pseudotabrizicola sediminis TaxID=2486418 RepID=A0ABY2KQI8_9RHOB|nr:hypothetical protein [Pseudotabrizicola sediminis]TGD45052.1 hypothetical protein EEB11_00235 [Pseudotabrizicola sediminis]